MDKPFASLTGGYPYTFLVAAVARVGKDARQIIMSRPALPPAPTVYHKFLPKLAAVGGWLAGWLAGWLLALSRDTPHTNTHTQPRLASDPRPGPARAIAP